VTLLRSSLRISRERLLSADRDDAACTGAVVRKPPMKETAGRVARWHVRRCGDFAAVSASTTFAIWHELCEWVKMPFAAPERSKP
jgi:hypothetical protein